MTTRPARARARVDELDRSIARMQRLLDTDRWPSGLELTLQDRELVRYNLKLARRERLERDAQS